MNQDPTDTTGFELQLGIDGPRTHVEATESTLDALRRIGGVKESDCESGSCGTCITQVLLGTPDHRDSILEPEERQAGDMLVCVSRSLSPVLVLDVPVASGMGHLTPH